MPDPFPADDLAQREELLTRVEKIRDVLTRTAAESEEARFLVPEAVTALRDTDLLKMKTAKELGGLDVTPITQMLVIAALTEIDAAAGWNTMVNNNSTGFMSAFLGDEAVAEVFTGNNPPIAAGVAPPMGKARKVDGGYLLTGRWRTCSGITQSSWLRLTGALEDGAPGQNVFCILPKADAQVHDTWRRSWRPARASACRSSPRTRNGCAASSPPAAASTASPAPPGRPPATARSSSRAPPPGWNATSTT